MNNEWNHFLHKHSQKIGQQEIRHEKSCKMSANQNSGIQMSTHMLAKKYVFSKNLIPIYDLKGHIFTHKGINFNVNT